MKVEFHSKRLLMYCGETFLLRLKVTPDTESVHINTNMTGATSVVQINNIYREFQNDVGDMFVEVEAQMLTGTVRLMFGTGYSSPTPTTAELIIDICVMEDKRVDIYSVGGRAEYVPKGSWSDTGTKMHDPYPVVGPSSIRFSNLYDNLRNQNNRFTVAANTYNITRNSRMLMVEFPDLPNHDVIIYGWQDGHMNPFTGKSINPSFRWEDKTDAYGRIYFGHTLSNLCVYESDTMFDIEVRGPHDLKYQFVYATITENDYTNQEKYTESVYCGEMICYRTLNKYGAVMLETSGMVEETRVAIVNEGDVKHVYANQYNKNGIGAANTNINEDMMPIEYTIAPKDMDPQILSWNPPTTATILPLPDDEMFGEAELDVSYDGLYEVNQTYHYLDIPTPPSAGDGVNMKILGVDVGLFGDVSVFFTANYSWYGREVEWLTAEHFTVYEQSSDESQRSGELPLRLTELRSIKPHMEIWPEGFGHLSVITDTSGSMKQPVGTIPGSKDNFLGMQECQLFSDVMPAQQDPNNPAFTVDIYNTQPSGGIYAQNVTTVYGAQSATWGALGAGGISTVVAQLSDALNRNKKSGIVGKKAIVCCTDALLWVNPPDQSVINSLISTAQESNTRVYAIIVNMEGYDSCLAQLASATGGDYVQTIDESGVREFFAGITADIRAYGTVINKGFRLNWYTHNPVPDKTNRYFTMHISGTNKYSGNQIYGWTSGNYTAPDGIPNRTFFPWWLKFFIMKKAVEPSEEFLKDFLGFDILRNNNAIPPALKILKGFLGFDLIRHKDYVEPITPLIYTLPLKFNRVALNTAKANYVDKHTFEALRAMNNQAKTNNKYTLETDVARVQNNNDSAFIKYTRDLRLVRTPIVNEYRTQYDKYGYRVALFNNFDEKNTPYVFQRLWQLAVFSDDNRKSSYGEYAIVKLAVFDNNNLAATYEDLRDFQLAEFHSDYSQAVYTDQEDFHLAEFDNNNSNAVYEDKEDFKLAEFKDDNSKATYKDSMEYKLVETPTVDTGTNITDKVKPKIILLDDIKPQNLPDKNIFDLFINANNNTSSIIQTKDLKFDFLRLVAPSEKQNIISKVAFDIMNNRNSQEAANMKALSEMNLFRYGNVEVTPQLYKDTNVFDILGHTNAADNTPLILNKTFWRFRFFYFIKLTTLYIKQLMKNGDFNIDAAYFDISKNAFKIHGDNLATYTYKLLVENENVTSWTFLNVADTEGSASHLIPGNKYNAYLSMDLSIDFEGVNYYKFVRTVQIPAVTKPINFGHDVTTIDLLSHTTHDFSYLYLVDWHYSTEVINKDISFYNVSIYDKIPVEVAWDYTDRPTSPIETPDDDVSDNDTLLPIGTQEYAVGDPLYSIDNSSYLLDPFNPVSVWPYRWLNIKSLIEYDLDYVVVEQPEQPQP